MISNASSRSTDRAPAALGVSRAPRRDLFVFWAPVVVYLAVIFAGSSVPALPDVPGGDKTAHIVEYAVLGFLLTRALAGPRWRSVTWPYVAGAVALAALYGVSDECHQMFVPGRQFDVVDMLADATGASLSAVALWMWGIVRRHRETG